MHVRGVEFDRDNVSLRQMTAEHVDDVVGLLREHLKLVPPVCLSKDEIKAVMADPGWFSRLHYPGEAAVENSYTTFVGLRGGRVVAAAQVEWLKDDLRKCLMWAVGERDEATLREFLEQVIGEVRGSGYRGISVSRNPFGIGWSGIPDCWPHVLNAARAVGFDVSERWQSYWIVDATPAARLRARL